MPFVNVAFKGSDIRFRIVVKADSLVSDLLNKARERLNNPYISKIYASGSLLDMNDLLFDCVENNELLELEVECAIPLDEQTISNNQVQNDLMHSVPNENGISYTKIQKKGVTEGNIVLFSNISIQMMTTGLQMTCNKNINVNDFKEIVIQQLRGLCSFPFPVQYHFYLPGGIPFVNGTIQEYLDAVEYRSNNIFVVITKIIPEANLSKIYSNVCNVKSTEMKLLISPLYNSTQASLTQMASFLGYISRNGRYINTLIEILSIFCGFDPFIRSLKILSYKEESTGRDIINITACFHTICKYILLDGVSNECVYEQLLKCCSFLLLHDSKKSLLKFNERKWTETGRKPIDMYCKRYNFENPLRIYSRPDELLLMKPTAIKTLQDIFSTKDIFKPVSPLTLRNVNCMCFVRGSENNTQLYLQSTESKDRNLANCVDIINPLVGDTEHVDIDVLAKRLGDTESDDSVMLIDPEKVTQIVMVCFDESVSMRNDISGRSISKKKQVPSRYEIARQHMTTFANRLYGYRISTIQGLISFNETITCRSKLSPMVPNFEEGILKINPDGMTALWDTLGLAADMLIDYNKDPKDPTKKRFPNSKFRIIVISDGEDCESKTYNPVTCCQKLIQNGIIVDAMVISKIEVCTQLAAICRLTGGFAFMPKTIDEGTHIFEQEAFLNNDLRPPANPYLKNITLELIDRIAESGNVFHHSVPNVIIQEATERVPIATLRHIISSMTAEPDKNREKRIMRELRKAATWDDQTFKIFPVANQIDHWRVFMQGPEDTKYAKRWWYLTVIFPAEYPIQPPMFRFIHPPYHINISDEGRICLNLLDKDYLSSMSITDLLVGIKGLLMLPNYDDPIQISFLNLYTSDKNAFNRKIDESVQMNSKEKYEDWMQICSCDLLDDNDPNLEINSTIIPQQFLCPITGKIMMNPCRASSGIFYEEEELRKLLQRSQNPLCLVTGQQLTMDIDLDQSFKNKITQWIRDNKYNQ